MKNRQTTCFIHATSYCKQEMEIQSSTSLKAHTLYEKKLVTYPRTDTQYITENEFAYLLSNIETYKKIQEHLLKFHPKSQINDMSMEQKSKNTMLSFPTKNIPSESH